MFFIESGSTGFVPGAVIIIVLVALLLGTIGSLYRRETTRAALFAGLLCLVISMALGAMANYDPVINATAARSWSNLPGWAFYAPICVGLALLALAGIGTLNRMWMFAVARRFNPGSVDFPTGQKMMGHTRIVSRQDLRQRGEFAQNSGDEITAYQDAHPQG